jgi:hypothetical protein
VARKPARGTCGNQPGRIHWAALSAGEGLISAELTGIFEWLGFTAESWRDAMGNLWGKRLLGRIFAASRIKLRAIAQQLGVRHLVNLTGCPLR